MTALAATLRRAAAFLDALPDDVPEPRVYHDNWQLRLDWIRADGGAVRAGSIVAWVNIQHGDLYLGVNRLLPDGSDAAQYFTFDGVTVPPEVVAAIRRVTGGGE